MSGTRNFFGQKNNVQEFTFRIQNYEDIFTVISKSLKKFRHLRGKKMRNLFIFLNKPIFVGEKSRYSGMQFTSLQGYIG